MIGQANAKYISNDFYWLEIWYKSKYSFLLDNSNENLGRISPLDYAPNAVCSLVSNQTQVHPKKTIKSNLSSN